MVFNYLTLPLIISGIILLVVTGWAWHFRDAPGAKPFALLTLCCAIYSLGYAMEISHVTLEPILFWLRVEYLGIALLPAFLILFALTYTGGSNRLPLPVLAAIFIIPILTLVIYNTDYIYKMYYLNVHINSEGPFPVIDYVKGPWYWVQVGYVAFATLLSNYLFFRMWLGSARIYRSQVAIMLVGSLIPWTVHIIYLSGIIGWNLDLAPFALTVSGILFFWGLFRYRLFELAPAARATLFEELPDGVLVLDREMRIVDMNAAAQQYLQLQPGAWGKAAPGVLEDWPELIHLLGDRSKKHQLQLQRSTGAGVGWYNIEIIPLEDQEGTSSGQMLLLRDITMQRRAEEALQVQLQFEKLIGDIAARFVDIPMASIDEAVLNALQLSGEFFAVDRSYLYRFSADSTRVINTHQWCAPGINPLPDEIKDFPVELLPWGVGRLYEMEPLHFPDMNALPLEAAAERERFKKQGIKSLLVVPFSTKDDGHANGFLGFETERARRAWTEDQINLLKLVAGIIAGALSKYLEEVTLYREHSHLITIFDSMSELVYIADPQTYEVLYVNEVMRKLFERDIVGGLCYRELQGKEKPCEYCTNDIIMQNKGEPYRWEHHNTLLGKDYLVTDVLISWSDGRDVRFELATEITERKRIEEALQQSENKLKAAFESSQDAITILSSEGKFIDCNQRALELYGLENKDDFLTSRPADFSPPRQPDGRDSHEASRELINKVVEKGGFLRFEWQHRRKDGTIFPAEVTLTSYRLGEETVLQATVSDITERKQNEEKLQYLSLHDALTGLYNRAFFDEEMERLNGSREYPVTIISADLDGLKLINDTMGHSRGDALLKACAEVLRRSVRGYDVVARIGGDEFALLLARAGEDIGLKVAGRIRRFCEEHNLEHYELPLHISLGVATALTGSMPLEETYKKADDLMYREKKARKPGVRSHTVDMLQAALHERDYMELGHDRRLWGICMLLGERLDLDQTQLINLALLSQVHDLGKLGIPDKLLFKKGPLLPEEWELMRQHPEKGYQIALSSPDLEDMAELILKHHEYWDGSGYPQGLRGENIPLECRIFAIADAFEAMTGERPYRQTKTPEEALAELERCRGIQFQPELVDLFRDIAGQGGLAQFFKNFSV